MEIKKQLWPCLVVSISGNKDTSLFQLLHSVRATGPFHQGDEGMKRDHEGEWEQDKDIREGDPNGYKDVQR